jgi:uncharacterized protein YccT (UPF0319 family)
MQSKIKYLTMSLVVLGLLCMLTSCGKVQTQRMYEGRIRPNTEIVRISIPESMRAVSINGQSTQEGLIEILGNPSELHILPGDTELGVQYMRTWDSDLDGMKRVKSDVITVSLSTQAGEAYEIKPNVKIETYRQSKAFAANPQLTVTKTKEANVANAPPISIMEDTVKTTASRSTSTAPAPPPDTPAPAADPPAPAPDIVAPDSPSNLEQLQQAWQKASQEERDVFIKSILKR